MEYARKDVEKKTKLHVNVKEFVLYQEGAEKYSLGLTEFQKLAKRSESGP